MNELLIISMETAYSRGDKQQLQKCNAQSNKDKPQRESQGERVTHCQVWENLGNKSDSKNNLLNNQRICEWLNTIYA